MREISFPFSVRLRYAGIMNRDDRNRREIGRRLALARRTAGLKQAEASATLGISNSGLSMIERGRRGIDAALLARAADLYRTDPGKLIGAHPKLEEPEKKELDAMLEYLEWRSERRRAAAGFAAEKTAPEQLGHALAEARLRCGMERKELASRLGIGDSDLARHESGGYMDASYRLILASLEATPGIEVGLDLRMERN